MLEFVTTDLHHERPAATDYYGVLLGLNCNFAIRLDHQVLFEEAEDTLLSMQEVSQIEWPDDRRPES